MVLRVVHTCDDAWNREFLLGQQRNHEVVFVVAGGCHDNVDRLYAGVVVEPVAGLAFSAGVSLREVEFAPPGTGLPGVGTEDATLEPEHGRVLRPYVGVTLTLDLLETLAEFKKAAGAISF